MLFIKFWKTIIDTFGMLWNKKVVIVQVYKLQTLNLPGNVNNVSLELVRRDYYTEKKNTDTPPNSSKSLNLGPAVK